MQLLGTLTYGDDGTVDVDALFPSTLPAILEERKIQILSHKIRQSVGEVTE